MNKNKDFKKFTILYIIVSIIVVAICGIIIDLLNNKLEDSYKNEIRSQVLEITADNNEYRKEITQRGIEDYSPTVYCKDISYDILLIKIVVCTIIITIFIIVYILIWTYVNKIYKKVDKITSDIDKIHRDMYEPENYTYESGSFENLYLQINELYSYVKRNRKASLDEKRFLRDTMSDISHQLKTPISSLKLFNELLLNDSVNSPDEKKKIFIQSQNQIKRIENMVISMLKLARIEAKSIIFVKKRENVYNTIITCINVLKIKINNKNINILINCNKEIELDYDEKWMEEAIINILNNAIQYTPDRGQIAIEVEATKLLINIIIRDNGIGIDKKDLPKIFNRFYRSNNSVNPNSVGIGLSLTKKIIEGNGGYIKAKSKIGEYTEFTISFILL